MAGPNGYPMTRIQEEAWFDESGKGPAVIEWAMETLEGKHLGFSALTEIDYRRDTAVSGSFLGASEIWGQGYGTEACRLRAGYARRVLGLRMLYVVCLDVNDRSRRVLEKTSFVEYGRCPAKVWHDGAFRDELQFALHFSTLDGRPAV